MAPSPGARSLPSTLGELRAALVAGVRELGGLQLAELDAHDLDLSHCNLSRGCFKEARFGRASLRQARVEGCCFQRALIWGADLSGLRAAQSFWQEADLSGSRLQAADFSAAQLHRCCLRGVVAAGSCWAQARLVEADFRSGLDQLTDLGQADFHGADLCFGLLQGANLHAANLQGCSLYGASLAGADLRQADLRGCDLRDTDLAGAQLEGAQLDGALLPCHLTA